MRDAFLRCLTLCVFAAPLLNAQQAAPPPDPAPPAAAETTTSLPQAETAAPLPAASTAAAAHPLTKAEEREQKKHDKEAAKKAKEEEEEANFLKLQGNDIVAPTLDADGRPITLQKCAKKDKECIKKRNALLHQKKVGMKIENATLTVDGWTGKARLNYEISEVKFLYISTPGVGTAVASLEKFPNSTEQKDALDGQTLTITTPDNHMIQLSSEKLLIDKKKRNVFVALDPAFTQSGQYPSFGYGSSARAPYNWPGVRPATADEVKLAAKAPPLPKGLEAATLTLPCQKVAPGEAVRPVKINGLTMTPAACPATSSGDAAAEPTQGSPGSAGTSTASSGIAANSLRR